MSTANSLMLNTSSFLDTVYFANRMDHQDKLTKEQISQSDALCAEMYKVILGPDSEVIPVCLENVRPLTVVPVLLSANYTKLSLSLLKEVNFTDGLFNIESERNRICRIFSNASYDVIEHLLYQKDIFSLIMGNFDIEKHILSSLSSNHSDGIYALVQSLLEKMSGGLKRGDTSFTGFARIEHIKRMISYSNNEQLSQAVDFEGMESLVDMLLDFEGNYICNIKHTEILDALFINDRFCSITYTEELLKDIFKEYWLDDRLFIYIDHVMGILPVGDIIKASSQANEYIWGDQSYAIPLIERFHEACEGQGDSLKNYPDELAKIVQKSVGFRKSVGLPVYVFLFRKGVVLGDVESRSMLSVLKDVHGMTPLQMITKAKPSFQPFMRMLVQEVLSKTKKTPLSLLENVDDWVKPYVMEMLV